MALESFDDLFQGRFLRAGNLHGKQVTLTIASVQREELTDDDNKKTRKATVCFRERINEEAVSVVLCKTNGICLRAMFGNELAAWVGKKVTLMPDVWNGEPCIRIAGSPDLAADKTVKIELARRKPTTRTLRKTGSRPATTTQATPAAPAATQQPTREPGEEG